MKIESVRLLGIRCFEDTGLVRLSPTCNVVVGHNNAGKSTFLKGIYALQVAQFTPEDARHLAQKSVCEIYVGDIKPSDQFNGVQHSQPRQMFRTLIRGNVPLVRADIEIAQRNLSNPHFFFGTTPNNPLIPFLARRKAASSDQQVNLATQSQITGTHSNLNSRIDLVASFGHPRHGEYIAAVEEITGLKITTKSSNNGKEAGFYLDEEKFVTLDRMGDGVTEMVAMIVELCLARDKIFVIEEPETNLHPRGVKALLALIRKASEFNQFVIATHSNIVVRELSSIPECQVLRVSKDGSEMTSPSRIESIAPTTSAHIELLRDLGYEFGDLALHDAWLFLEESSAEEVVRDVLIPMFVPRLRTRLRTYSASGVTNLEPALSEFQRLITFVHLQPAYQDRFWVRADGDPAGIGTVQALRTKFPYLNDATCSTFSNPHFEDYYPEQFQETVKTIFEMEDKKQRREKKSKLLRDVKQWTDADPSVAKFAWGKSAKEVIDLLSEIEAKLR